MILGFSLCLQSPSILKASRDLEENHFLFEDASEEEIKDAKETYKELKDRQKQANDDLNNALAYYEKKEGGPINFEKQSAKITDDSFQVIDITAKVIKKYPRLNLRIEGHTDSRGDDIANLILSEKRAKSVEEYLVKVKKISGDRIVSVGFGESKPIANNRTWTGRLINRRVEFHFYIP